MFIKCLQTLSLCSLLLLSTPSFIVARQLQTIQRHHHTNKNKLILIQNKLYELQNELTSFVVEQEQQQQQQQQNEFIITTPITIVKSKNIPRSQKQSINNNTNNTNKNNNNNNSIFSSASKFDRSSNILFSPYKDITTSADWNTDTMRSSASGSLLPIVQSMPSTLQTLTWAFATGECGSENWAGMSATTFAQANVNAFVTNNKNYIVSTGGSAGSFRCSSDSGFDTFITRYNSANLIGIDFDIEDGQSEDDINNLIQRVKHGQQKYPNLRFSFTISTLAPSTSNVAVDQGANSPNPLGDVRGVGNRVMNAIQSGGLQNYYINLMTMDYGAASQYNCVLNNGVCDMGQSAIQAAMDFHGYFKLPYSQIELTPMSGPNDTGGETFSLQDVHTVSAWATANGISGIHFWSYDRDLNLGFVNEFSRALGL